MKVGGFRADEQLALKKCPRDDLSRDMRCLVVELSGFNSKVLIQLSNVLIPRCEIL